MPYLYKCLIHHYPITWCLGRPVFGCFLPLGAACPDHAMQRSRRRLRQTTRTCCGRQISNVTCEVTTSQLRMTTKHAISFCHHAIMSPNFPPFVVPWRNAFLQQRLCCDNSQHQGQSNACGSYRCQNGHTTWSLPRPRPVPLMPSGRRRG